MTDNGKPPESISPMFRQMQMSELAAKLREVKAIADDKSQDDTAREAAAAEVDKLGKAYAELQMTRRYFG